MKIVATAAPQVTTPAQRVEPTRTPVSRADLRAAITRALEKTDGTRPSPGLVDVLTAHASLETASGDQMFNYNFGGIKGRSPTGETALCRTHEVMGGKDVVIRDGFRAYRTLDDGAVDYVKTMKTRFGAALAPAERGDAAGFAHALKGAGYYTASEADYAKGIARLMSAPAHGATSPSAPSASASASRGDPRLTSSELARVDDALDAARWMDVSGVHASSHTHSKDDDDDS